MTDEKKLSKRERKEQARVEYLRKLKPLWDELERELKPFVDEYWRKVKPLQDEYGRKEKPFVDELKRTLREIDAEDDDEA